MSFLSPKMPKIPTFKPPSVPTNGVAALSLINQRYRPNLQIANAVTASMSPPANTIRRTLIGGA